MRQNKEARYEKGRGSQACGSAGIVSQLCEIQKETPTKGYAERAIRTELGDHQNPGLVPVSGKGCGQWVPELDTRLRTWGHGCSAVATLIYAVVFA